MIFFGFEKLLIKDVQFSHISRLPRLVFAAVVDDAGVLPYPVQRADVTGMPCVIHGENAVAQIVAIAVLQLNLLAVQGGDDVLIRQEQAVFLVADKCQHVLCGLLLPQLGQVQQHYAGVEVGDILRDAQPQAVHFVEQRTHMGAGNVRCPLKWLSVQLL